ncbi:MAG: OmpA family protein [Flavobacteriales bacterium]|nr:OmpA family protein [Flavobacteriales bacterium]
MNIKHVALVSAVSFLAVSCVSKKDLVKCQDDLKKCEESNLNKNLTIAQLDERVKSLTAQLENCRESSASYQKSLTECVSSSGQSSVNIEKLIGQIEASNDYIKRLTDARFRQDSLNTALSNKLKRSLDNINDDDVDVKVQKGVVFISLSDKMLYKSGSYNILPSAENVLAKVAKVINDYKDYDVLVEGHTDNDPISTSCIKDNWDLSAHRATAVVRELQTKFNVNPSRMTAGGRGEYVPKVDNLNDEMKSTNRRTEIIILPKLDEFMKLMDIKPTKK